jgi:hypothetical protein
MNADQEVEDDVELLFLLEACFWNSDSAEGPVTGEEFEGSKIQAKVLTQ